MHPHIREWQEQTKQGFGNVVVVGCELKDIKNLSNREGLYFGTVVDPTYPYIVNSEVVDLISSQVHTETPIKLDSGDYLCFRDEITCAYLFIDKNTEEQTECVKHLKLHP